MKFRRRSAKRRGPRQRQLPDLTPTSIAYRPQRNEAAREPGRQNTVENLSISARHWGIFWLQRLGLLIMVVAVVASLVNILTLSDVAKVVTLGNGGSAPLLQPSEYTQAASRALSASIWNRNKITVNTSQVSRQLLQQFPELNSVSVTIPLLAHQPIVYVAPAQPTLVLVNASGAFIIGNTGKAILAAATPAAFKQPTLPVLTDQSGFHVQLNHQALASTSIQFIQTVIGQLAAKQYSVSGLVLPPGASELDVHLSGQTYLIKFNLQSNDARGQAGIFLATITQLHRQSITPATYVDVRVEGRSYYK